MRSAPLGYVRSLDGLRALAILLVMGCHNMGPLSARVASRFAGWSGVDMFFVISGFLITSLLLDEQDRSGSYSFSHFYVRRILRIAPAYLLFLLLMLFWRGRSALPTFGICLIYLSDYAAAFKSAVFDPAFGITWSLSVEEQFYLLWPFLLWVAARWPLRLVLCSIAAVIGWRALMVSSGATWQRLYFAFDTRFDSILIGCAGALLRRHAKMPRVLAALSRRVWLVGLPLVVSLATLHYFADRGVWFWCVRLPLHNALSAALILALLGNPASSITRVLGSRPLVFIGRLSYSLYLWHEFAFDRVRTVAGALMHASAWSWINPIATEVVSFAFSVLLASASYFAVEQPFLRLKKRLQPRPAASSGQPVGIVANGPL